MANILEVFTTAWKSMPQEQRQQIMDEVAPNKVVRGVLYSLSHYYGGIDEHEEDISEDDSDENIIDAEFVDSGLDDGFGA